MQNVIVGTREFILCPILIVSLNLPCPIVSLTSNLPMLDLVHDTSEMETVTDLLRGVCGTTVRLFP